MKQKVIIKSNKYGLIVHMDPDAEYTEILKELREKFTESARFFKDSRRYYDKHPGNRDSDPYRS